MEREESERESEKERELRVHPEDPPLPCGLSHRTDRDQLVQLESGSTTGLGGIETLP